MAFVNWTIPWEGTTAGVTLEEGAATVNYDVEVSGTSDDMPLNILIARDAPGLPIEGEVHPLDPFLFVDNKQAFAKSPTMVGVTVNYKSFKDPLQAEPEVFFTFANSTAKLDVDVYGNPITNSSDEPLDVEQEFDDLVYHIKFNSSTYNVDIASMYQGSVNGDVWRNFAPYKCKCIKYLGVPTTQGPSSYFVITIEIQIRDQFEDDNWDVKVKDEGYRTKGETDPETGEPDYTTIVDSDGNPISEPVALNGSGGKLADGAEINYLTFPINRAMPFQALNLPGS